MTTARDIVTRALKEAGICGTGQDPIAENINDGFTSLEDMIATWQRKRWLVPMLVDIAMPGNNLRSNRIGPGQYWNAPRPDKINSAYVVQLFTGQNQVSLPMKVVFSREDYNLIAIKGLNSLPEVVFYDNAFPYGNVFVWPVPNSTYEVHLTYKGQIGFAITVSEGEIEEGGFGYVDGNYIAIPLESLDSNGGQDVYANVVVAGGVVTTVALTDGGSNYVINDTITVDNVNLGGSGSGFIYRVTNTSQNVDSQFNMPPEYKEVIHYNLTCRIMEFYNRPPSVVKIKLAKIGLNTLRQANTQVPTLLMPAGVTNGRAFNIYNPDGY